MNDIKDYLNLYHGCECQTVDGIGIFLGLYYPDVWIEKGNLEPNGMNIYYPDSRKVYAMNFNQCKLILRPLSDMTKQEAKVLGFLFPIPPFPDLWTSQEDWSPSQVIKALKNHFDLFGLIESGFAIDKTKELKTI